MTRVLSLFSGSLASRIASRLVQHHPTVEGMCLLHFRSPFAHEPEDLRTLVRAEWTGTALRTQSLKREYRRLIDTKSIGEFDLAESCTRCRRLLLQRTVRYMERTGSDYVVTGELPGLHDVTPDRMEELDAEVGLEGRVLRPLCVRTPARVPSDLRHWTKCGKAEPRADIDAWLRRLAEGLGLDPVDEMRSNLRCKLTLPGFGDRVCKLFREPGSTLNELRLLDFPLFYALHSGAKVVVARSEQEKRELQNLFLPSDMRVYTAAPHGPMTLVRTGWRNGGTPEDREAVTTMAARITATHLGGVGGGPMTPTPVYYRFENENDRVLVNVTPFASCDQIAEMESVDVVPLEATPIAVS